MDSPNTPLTQPSPTTQASPVTQSSPTTQPSPVTQSSPTSQASPTEPIPPKAPTTPAVVPPPVPVQLPPENDIEKSLRRINNAKNVKGTIIVGKDGTIIRSTINDESLALKYANHVLGLAILARSSVRELDNENEMRMLRLRTVTHELIVVYEEQFILIVVQGLKDSQDLKDEETIMESVTRE